MKRPIGWHKQNLDNTMKYRMMFQARVDEGLKRIKELDYLIATLGYQISEAERIGKKEFDVDKFRKSKAIP